MTHYQYDPSDGGFRSHGTE